MLISPLGSIVRLICPHILDSIAEDHPEFNALLNDEEHSQRKYVEKTKQLRDLHLHVKDGYDRLYRITAKGPNSQEFIEPQVQRLWKQAVAANFTNEELISLKVPIVGLF